MKSLKKIDKQNIEDILGLTSMQEGMLFHYITDPSSDVYMEQICLYLSGSMDIEYFRKAWEYVIDNNEMLRTVFRWEGLENPVQIILKNYNFAIIEHDFSCIEPNLREKSLNEVIESDRKLGIDIGSETLRIILCKLDHDKYAMLISSHHIFFDGWSNGIILEEFFKKYNSFFNNKVLDIGSKTKFKEYIRWLKSQDKKTQEKYWKDYLDGFDTRTVIPQEHKNHKDFKGTIKNFSILLENQSHERLNNFTKEHQLTLAALFYTAWGILLQKYNNLDDVIFGTTVSGRTPELNGVEGIVGLFINTIPLRVQCHGKEHIVELLHNINNDLKNREEFETTSLTDIKSYYGIKGTGNIFDSIVVIDNYPLDQKSIRSDSVLNIDSYYILEKTNFDLTLQILTFNDIKICFNYDADKFSTSQIERLAGHFSNILNEIINNPHKSISTIEMLGEDEKRKLIYDFNNTAKEYPYHKTIHKLFEERAKEIPDSVAVSFDGRTLSYKELNEKANQLARLLVECGVGNNTMVGLMVPRSLEMIIGIMAILKANGICLPLDTGHPEERINFILEDSDTHILIELEGYDYIKNFKGSIIKISENNLFSYGKDNLEDKIDSKSLAFLIYTSGSTGKPKGTMLHHRGIINHVNTKASVLELIKDDVIGNNFSVNVVASIWQILAPLLLGGKLVIHSEEVEKNPYEQFNKISEDNITVIEVIPSILNAYLDSIENGLQRINLPKLRRIALTSEETKPFLVNKFHKYYDITLVDCYGQTECCDDTLHFSIPVSTCTEIVPIGTPSQNTRAYVLDRYNSLQPVGVVGELCISGDGVAKGYWNRPELNSEKFIPNPYENGNIMYKTGDLARWREDGNVECLGRIDHQVKIRGNRIELGEIESRLMKYPGIKSVAIIVKDDGENGKALTTFFISDKEFTVSELRSFLLKDLPDYSVPSYFVRLENMPLTPNGKIDRKVLQKLEGNAELGTEYIAPSSELEKVISVIWQEVLKRDKIGINDNFFDCGGHSLLLIKVMNRLQKQLNIDISVVEMFQYTTVSSLAQYISNNQKERHTAESNIGNPKKTYEKKHQNDIAVIGISGRFPGAENIKEFWDNLVEGKETVSFFEDEEIEFMDESVINDQNYVNAWGVLKDIDMFDAAFFGLSSREAEIMDPQQRLFMECAWEALENAGYINGIENGKIGVYAGSGFSTYMLQNIASNPEITELAGNFQIAIGNDKDFIATRTAYKLGLTGPSMTIQSACSTSLVAVHTACQALINGECDIALSGAAHIKTPQRSGYIYESGGNMSPDGHCRTFDADAKGSVMGNGVGVVVLKRLSEALNDGDYIYAVIKGSAVNNDGFMRAGYTAPGIEGQIDVVLSAQAKAGVSPESISYIETHGTGTELGDPIEIAALSKAFGRNTQKKGFCAIGALKTNIGHLDVAAGVSGLIKTVLSLKNKMLPPTLNFELPNFQINIEDSPFYINTSLSKWETDISPRRAGVSSFGIGGTNAHVIVEEAPDIKAESAMPMRQIMILSAKTASALETATQKLYSYLKDNPDSNLSNVAYTLQVGRVPFCYRCAFTCNDCGDALSVLENRSSERLLSSVCETNAPIAFVFTGDFYTYNNMGYDLYSLEPVYQREADRCFNYIMANWNMDLKDIVYRNDSVSITEDVVDTHISFVWTFIIQYSLAKLLVSWGALPEMVVGIGTGEYAAACISRILEPEDALRVLMKKIKPKELNQTVGKLGNKSENVKIRSPRIAFLSASKECCIHPGQFMDMDFNLDSIQTLKSDLPDTVLNFLDESRFVHLMLGTSQIINNLLKFYDSDSKGKNIAPLILGMKDTRPYAEILSDVVTGLWLTGVKIDWPQIHPGIKRFRIPLPTYPFEKTSYWITKSDYDNEYGVGQVLPEKNKDFKAWFYSPVWKQSNSFSLIDFDSLSFEKTRWLIFMDDLGIGSQIVKKLIGMDQEVITVHKGKGFTKLDKCSYTIKPEDEIDYDDLMLELSTEGKDFGNIVHLWSVDRTQENPDKFETFKKEQLNGFYSLIYITKALCKANIIHPLEVWVVSRDMQKVSDDDITYPEKAALLGPCKVIHQEHPNIFCHSVDISGIETDYSKVVENLLLEFSLKTDDMGVAYRKNSRWIQDIEQIPLGTINNRLVLKENGTYLITGGLGEVGLILAESLAREVNANLILVGRSVIPEKKYWKEYLESEKMDDITSKRIEKMLELQNYGGNVLYESADVTDIERMREVLEKASSMFDSVNGVIHLAGITGEKAVKTINELEKSECELQFEPKVKGLYVLEEIFRGKELDFCMTVSSLCAILGGLGSTAYSSANIFSDAFAAQIGCDRAFPLISVNWEAWMSDNVKRKWATLDKLAISGIEGQRIFDVIMSCKGISRLVVSTGDMKKRIKQWIKREKLQYVGSKSKALRSTHKRPFLKNDYIPPETHLEKVICQVWQELLGVNKIGINDNFFELGGHSLLATRIMSRIRGIFRVDMPIRSLFDRPTVIGLKEAIEGICGDVGLAEEIASIYLEVEGLSHDELEHMLQKMDVT